jgi:ribose-phosphate pyrophosphokinase
MQTLNLIKPEKSDIGYSIINFPDGEPHIVLEEINRKESVKVICRITNPIDLFIVTQVGSILNRQGVMYSFDIKYLMSMRMDRVISFNEAYSLEIVLKMLKMFNPISITVLEPHNDLAIFVNEGAGYPSIKPDFSECLVVFPDKGTYERYKDWYDKAVICSKVRDISTGKLTSFSIDNPEILEEHPDKPLVVIDDLCDGGGTFVGIAKLLNEKCPNRPKSIFVTHAVNPKGIDNMSKHYDNVYITNSYRDWADWVICPENVTVIDVV